MNAKQIGIIHIETDEIKLKLVHQSNSYSLQKQPHNEVNNNNPVSSEIKSNDVKDCAPHTIALALGRRE